ncbi:MAG: hypothetical protein RLN62_05350 [Rickettsiales bacterium]
MSEKIKKLVLVGPGGLDDFAAKFRSDPNCHVIGDGISAISTDQLLDLRDRVDRNTEIIVSAHGENKAGRRTINLFEEFSSTEKVLAAIERINSGDPKQLYLMSCYSGAAVQDAGVLSPGSVMVAYAREDEVMHATTGDYDKRTDLEARVEGELSVCDKMLLRLPHDLRCSARYAFVQSDRSVKKLSVNIEDIDFFESESLNQSIQESYNKVLESMREYIPSWARKDPGKPLRAQFTSEDLEYLFFNALSNFLLCRRFEQAEKLSVKMGFKLKELFDPDKGVYEKFMPDISGILRSLIKAKKVELIKLALNLDLSVNKSKSKIHPIFLGEALIVLAKHNEFDLIEDVLGSNRKFSNKVLAKILSIAIDNNNIKLARDILSSGQNMPTYELTAALNSAVKTKKIDLAKEIFFSGRELSEFELESVMLSAIKNNEIEFANIILESEQNISFDFLNDSLRAAKEVGAYDFAEKLLEEFVIEHKEVTKYVIKKLEENKDISLSQEFINEHLPLIENKELQKALTKRRSWVNYLASSCKSRPSKKYIKSKHHYDSAVAEEKARRERVGSLKGKSERG